ncbi:universal stress protein [Bacillus haimaensis]|uniref:universal stress protein n=1 Tax=Bacillus haimaensis TaxID=3160967 RepID=UPI003AA84042
MMNVSYRNILVAIDGTEEAKLAFHKAIHLCLQNNAALFIAHVIDIRSIATMEAYAVTMTEEAEAHARELLHEYGEVAKRKGIHTVKTIMEFGSPKQTLPNEIAEDHHIDLMVCGSSDMNLAERLVSGSVSEKIVRHANCDVLVVRG